MLDTISDLIGKVEKRARKPWITQEMISKMDERRKCMYYVCIIYSMYYVCMYVHVYVCMYMCVHMYVFCIYVRVFMYVCTYTCMYVSVYVCMYICIHHKWTIFLQFLVMQ